MINYSKYTDKQLLKLIQQDDDVAFTEIYNRYWKQLYYSAYRHLKVDSLAEEVVQDIFISFYLNKEKVVIKDSLKGYLYTLVKHRVLNEIRSAIVRSSYKNTIEQTETIASETPLTRLALVELQNVIHTTVSNLPQKCQEAYRLSREENLSHHHIAEQMDISVSTVEKHIGKALKTLRKNIKGYESVVIVLVASLF
nr:RNA polymerase sigma-70 factor [uncultured Pedobacter sp.]